MYVFRNKLYDELLCILAVHRALTERIYIGTTRTESFTYAAPPRCMIASVHELSQENRNTIPLSGSRRIVSFSVPR